MEAGATGALLAMLLLAMVSPSWAFPATIVGGLVIWRLRHRTRRPAMCAAAAVTVAVAMVPVLTAGSMSAHWVG